MTSTIDRVAVFIDGSNLFHRLKAPELGLPNLSFYDYAGLCTHIADVRQIVFRAYYVGVIKVDPVSPDRAKAERMRRQQNLLFGHLQSKNQQFEVKKGYLMKSDGSYHEKGVDVEIAVDLVTGAYEDLYDTAILISSDTDLLPAIKIARGKGKKVEYVGFSDRPSFGLQRNCDSSRLLVKSELTRFATDTKLKP